MTCGILGMAPSCLSLIHIFWGGFTFFLLLPVTGISLCVPVEIEESESSPEPVSYTHLVCLFRIGQPGTEQHEGAIPRIPQVIGLQSERQPFVEECFRCV